MSIRIKVEGGTVASNVHMCRTCEHSQIMKGDTENREITYCRDSEDSRPHLLVPFRVSQCNLYSEKSLMAPRKAMQEAYYLEKMPYSGKVVSLTQSQLNDYHFHQQLVQADRELCAAESTDTVIGRILGDRKYKRTLMDVVRSVASDNY